nr:hypothetical protein [Tanacetum cinerariifolium]
MKGRSSTMAATPPFRNLFGEHLHKHQDHYKDLISNPFILKKNTSIISSLPILVVRNNRIDMAEV